MMRRRNSLLLLLFRLAFLLPASALYAAPGDSLTPLSHPKAVRNYIRPTLYFNFFTTGSREISSKNTLPYRDITQRLGDYKFVSSSLGLYVPLYTHAAMGGDDSTDVNTFHLLMTMNGLSDQPRFSGLEKQHKLYKLGLGLRAIYGFNSKFVLFVDASPYAVGDRYDKQQTQEFRLASSAVFNVMIDPAFSLRFGITKTFLFGNRFYLPMIGFRIGRLDSKFYFNFQFPRATSFNFQPSAKFAFSIYSKAYGGLYTISNKDSIYAYGDKTIQLGQSGFANGIRFDFRPGPGFSFFFATGFSVRNNIRFYSHSYNIANHQRPFAYFYAGKPDPALFINVGLTWRFGKSKKSGGNYLMYDIFDLNNSMDPGDNNAGPGNGDIRHSTKEEEMKKVQYKDVADLIDDTDLY